MVFGTFDSLHSGHLNLFAQAKQYGDYLIVVVARDINVKKIKGRYPQLSEGKRQKIVQKIKTVNKAVLGYKKNRFKIIKELKPDVICLGYDQGIQVAELKNKLTKLNTKVKIYRLRSLRPEKYKSSLLNNN